MATEQSFQVRKLQLSDKGKGFIDLLRQLSVCDPISDEDFEARFQELSSHGDDHLICVIEDERQGKIVATGGLHLGKKIVEFLADHARSKGCYKVILDCSSENKAFYERCGFKEKEIQMVQYFV
ncbi:unnamed protein product [Linum tenue]|uniref:Glucosamine 6-phosphate N-acetyltransferase n=1 Tax=Linum tenue TaxID=586396 RepID=A0AAV0I2J9_9ROSI|nr:unnamed protein product [Linum tenue]CAI0540004.1 unnamed protein product [Linum tenue]